MSHCEFGHDAGMFALSSVLCVGIALSYVPQIVRIVLSGSSIGLSPWYLFLGATASTSSFFNVVTLQWFIVECCPRIPASLCIEHLMGIMQTGIQWLSFCIVCVGSDQFRPLSDVLSAGVLRRPQAPEASLKARAPTPTQCIDASRAS